jgi:hypothetical protein
LENQKEQQTTSDKEPVFSIWLDSIPIIPEDRKSFELTVDQTVRLRSDINALLMFCANICGVSPKDLKVSDLIAYTRKGIGAGK